MTGTHITPREKEILELLAIGKTSEEIADIEGISHHTVNAHKAVLKDKFGVYKDTALVAAAIRSGVIE